MADSNVAITAGSGTNIDTFTQAGGDHRQAVVVGDASAAYTATVDSSGRLSVLPSDLDAATSATITASDLVVAGPTGVGNVVSGTSTAGSYVVLACPGGDATWNVGVSSLTTGNLYFEVSFDSTNGIDGNWIAVNGRQLGVLNTNLAWTITANGVWQGTTAGAKYVRVRSWGGIVGTPTVVIRIADGASGVYLGSSIPTGSNIIGTVDTRGTAFTSTSGAISAAGTGTIGPLDVGRQGNVTFIVKNTTAGSAWAGAPVLVFEQSDDNVSYSPLIVVRNDTQVAASTHVLGVGVANAELMLDAAAEAMNYVRCRVTTGPATNGLTVVIQAGSLAFSPNVVATVSPVATLPMGTATGTTAAATGQVGRSVRTCANVAQTSAATMIAAAGSGLRIYVTSITCTNEGASTTVVRLFAGSLPSAAGAVATINDCFDFAIAGSGGGAGVTFPPQAPWALPANTALSFAVTIATTWDVTIGYYVAP